MIFVYGISALVILILVLLFRNHKKELFKDLPKKDHPLRFFYGFSAKLYELYRKFFPEKPDSKVNRMIKSLYVKENVRTETFIYCVKKVSLCVCILLAACLLGFLTCAASRGITAVTSLTRNEYGDGSASYELNVNYDGEEETVEIEIEEREYTQEEIYALFEEAYEALQTEVLGENESFDSVSLPLDLVSDYGEVDIFWEIEDTDVLDYNGEITADIEEGESITLNLFATFSLEDTSAIYTFPVTLVGETLSEKEVLVSEILKAIEENNSVYDSEVELPDSIDGKKITFSEIEDSNEALFLILALLALLAIVLVYDRNLEDQIKKRQEQMLLDFTEIVTKLNLLYEAGLSIYGSLERIVSDYESRNEKEEHFAYREVKLALEKIKSGQSEGAAYEEFGQRCGLHPYIKLGNILSQNLSKGSRGMSELLNQEAEEAFAERKRLARKKGEEASTKMIFPMIILLVIVIVIVAVPALMSINL